MGKLTCMTVLLLTNISVTVVVIIAFSQWRVHALIRWPLASFRNITIDNYSTTMYVNESVQSLTEMNKRIGSTVKIGGKFHPKNCTPVSRVAILIPYRDREENLHKFLNHMHPFLQRQNIVYGIYVIEIDNSTLFNRGLLMNVGFIESLKEDNYSCIVLHDVDLLPEDYRVSYVCPEAPTHLSGHASQFSYSLPYPDYFGGVSSIPTTVFRQINGMSNIFFGWGGEDDELFHRLRQHNWTIARPPRSIARYRSLPHKKEPEKNTVSFRLCLISTTRQRTAIDGLNSVKYTLLKKQHMPLYTWILIQVNSTQILTENKYLFSVYKSCLATETAN